jgi:hypothetical protein
MADLNDLQREWDSQPDYSEKKMNEIAELVRTRSGFMRSRLFRRDLAELIAGVIIIIFFGFYWLQATNWMTKTGTAITIAGAVEIIVLTQIVQRRGRADFTSVPLKEFLLSEVKLLNRQIALLRHVVWWYILPLYLGACLFAMGISLDDEWQSGRAFGISFCVGYFVLCTFIWWLNQYGRRRTLEPLRDAMQRTYDGLSGMDSEPAAADSDLVDVLANPALDAGCQPVRFVRPTGHQIMLVLFACLGGVAAGMLVQSYSGAPMRFEEWPLVGLMVAGMIAFGSLCVRRIRKDD